MARNSIDIGTLGNDGTGDSIRDAFRKVNDNFRELYGSLGLGERLSFTGLDQTPNSFQGQDNRVLAVSEEGGGQVVFKSIVGGNGVSINNTPSSISISSLFSSISGDKNPQLGGNLSAQSANTQFRIQDLATPVTSDEAANKGYVDTKISLAGVEAIDPDGGQPTSAFGRMTGPLILSRDPEPDDDETYNGLIAATKRYVDASAFGSVANLYVATSGEDSRVGVSNALQGRALAYAYRTIEAALKRAEEIINESPLEIGPYKKVLTYNDGANFCYLTDISTSPLSGSGFLGTTFVSIDEISIHFGGANYAIGDILTVSGGTGLQARYEVLDVDAFEGSGGRGPILSIKQLSAGKYRVIPGSVISGSVRLSTTATNSNGGSTPGSGATFNTTFNVNSVEIDEGGAGTGYTLVSVRFVGGGGSNAFGTATVNQIDGSIDTLTITSRGSGFTGIPTCVVDLPRFLIFTNGQRTDFTGDVLTGTPEAIRGRDIREGLYLYGEASGALAQILAHTGALDGTSEFGNLSEVFDVDIIYGSFQEGERIAYGDITRNVQISVFIESGIYEENLPIKIPQNVAVIGDEFRRTIIRPKLGFSTSPWALINFRRDRSIDSLVTSDRLFGYHYLENSDSPIYPIVNNKGSFNSAAELLSRNKLFLQTEVVSWIDYQIEENLAPFTSSFSYNSEICKRDVGLIIDSMIYDLKYGGYNRTVSAALKYRDPYNESAALAISSQLDETLAAIERLEYLVQRIIQNIELDESQIYSTATQIADAAYQAERGAGALPRSISAASQANPVRLTFTAAHGYADKEKIDISGIAGGSMTNLNGNTYYVKTVANQPTRIDLYTDFNLTTSVNGAGFTAYVPGSGGTVTPQGGAVGILIDVLLDIIENSPSNLPKNNDELDVFLCNDAVILRAMTMQGHGGFALVLDPEGQILAKSPYAQEGAVFSKSTGYKKFGGGMFVDGFTGNLQFRITNAITSTRLAISGLIRPPQLPCSFIVNDEVYRINYLRQYIFDPAGSTAQFELDETTPFSLTYGALAFTFTNPSNIATVNKTGHGLQSGATIRFALGAGGVLPSGITAGQDYYVLLGGKTANTFRFSDEPDGDPVEITSTGSGTLNYERIYEVLMPGNRSMLSNDFTQVNDLGYGLIATNGGLTEAVSMFTYYCHVSYYSINGGQIRSIGGSSSHGNFALVAEGADPLEVPTPVSLYHKLSQRFTVVTTPSQYSNRKASTAIYGYYEDYNPLNGSELEINHNGALVKYSISTVEIVNAATKFTKLNISSSGGLQFSVPNGAICTIRQNSYVVLTGDVVDVATRPSTALKLADSNDIYRVLDFSAYDSAYDGDTFTITGISIANPGVITTDIAHRQQIGYKVKIIKATSGATVPESIDADVDPDFATEYYITSVPSDYTFTISAVDGGTPVNTSADVITLSGTVYMIPFGLALTQLRENYNYVDVGAYISQPYSTPSSLVTYTVTPGTPGVFNKVAHGLTAGTMLKFNSSGTGSSLPSGIGSIDSYYWVVSQDLAADSFKVSNEPPIDSTLIGVGGTLSGTTITGLACTENIAAGDRLVSRPNITSVSGVSTATLATLTFIKQPRPPYLANQSITVSGFGGGGTSLNGTKTVISCTTTTVTYANSTIVASASGGTITVVATGSLGTDPTVLTIVSETSITIDSTSPSNGTVVFNIEKPELNVSTTGVGTQVYGTLIGGQNSTTLAVGDLSILDAQRVNNGIAAGTEYEFVYQGTTYQITNYQSKASLGTLYGLITVSPAFDISPISFDSQITLKAGIPVYSSFALGTLTIRISLTRVTSHDLLDIGTGSYADTNYPNEIYGQAVNSIDSVPLAATSIDEEGNAVTRAQTQERGSGRVFFVTTDQFGNFSVGPYFRVDQGTGSVTFAASLALSNLDGLGFKRGATIAEFSTDDNMADPQQDTVPTESAIVGYIERRLGTRAASGAAVAAESRIPNNTGGFLALSGILDWEGPDNLKMSNYKIVNLADPENPQDAVNLRSLTISNIDDFDLDNIRGGDLAIFTGAESIITNAEISSGGDITLSLDSTAHSVTLNVQNDKIVNSQINSAAAIDQSKLSLNNAYATSVASILSVSATGTGSVVTLSFASTTTAVFTAGQKIIVSGFAAGTPSYNGIYTVSTCTATQITYAGTKTGSESGGSVTALKGISGFDSSQFDVTNGWASLKTNGIPTGKLQQITTKTALANNSAGTDNVAAVAFTTIVEEGGAILKSQYSSLGFLRKTGAGASDYGMIAGTDLATGSTVAVRSSGGNIAFSDVTANRLLLNNDAVTPVAQTILDLTGAGTGGYTQLYGYNGSGASVGAIFVGDGTVANDKKTLYYNESHIFYTQNGLSNAPITCGNVTSTGTVSVYSLSAGNTGSTATVSGTWTLNAGARFQATYSADLAEYYEGDREYEVGTVLVFGGDKEVTVSTKERDHRVAGIISDNAGYVMNGACPGYKNLIALQGRVPCKVVGKVNKGDLMVTSNIPGVAVSAKGSASSGTILGKALADYDSDHIGTIELAVGRA
jgi:hypothetical protein